MDAIQTEATQTADGLVDTGADIVQEVREQEELEFEQPVADEAVDFSAPEVVTEQEVIPEGQWEVEARKFQSMYDRAQSDNDKLKKLEPLGDLLETRPDLVDLLQKNITSQQQPTQPATQGALREEDFNPWDAYYNPESPSYKFRINQDTTLVGNMMNQALNQQKQQMTEEITYNNTVNELRNTYKFSDNDVQNFMGFVTQPKEQVGLSNLVKLFRDVNKKSNAPETAEAVRAAQQQPRTAGVLQGGQASTPKTEDAKIWDGIMNAGSRNSVL